MPKTLSLAARKARAFCDMLYTQLRLKELGVPLRAPLTRMERIFYFRFRPALLGEDLIVYDIGASTGDVSVTLAKLANVKTVFAFEPIPEVFEQLEKRVEPLGRVRCFNVALGAENGTATLHQSEFTHSSSLLPMADLHREEFPHTAVTTERAVPVARLDDLVLEKGLPPPDVVKMDVQGFEDRVLAGGEQTFRQARFCALEMSLETLYEGGLLFDELYDRLRALGYRFAGFADQTLSEDTGRVLQVDALFRRERLE